MRLLIGVLILMSASFMSQSAEAQISTQDMLKRIDQNRISFQRIAPLAAPSQVIDQLMAANKARYPRFKPSMWYLATVKSGGYQHIIQYDWGINECQYSVINEAESNKKSQAIIDFVMSKGKKGSAAARMEIIPMKYCEQIYNFYSEKKD